MSDSLTLALLQHDPTPARKDESLARIEQQLAAAAGQGAELLLVPEASLSGYNIPLEQAQALAEAADGTTAEHLGNACRKHQLALAYGFIERAEGQLFNSVQVIDKQGERLACYRKTHLWGSLDRELFSAGNGLQPIIELQDWRIGLLICYDVEFPETSRTLALQGAELILVPTALMTPWAFVAENMVRVRAAENQLYVAYANYCGEEHGVQYVGRSCIAGPDGTLLAQAAQSPELLLATLHKAPIRQIRETLPYLRDRQPALYSLGQ